MLTLRYNKDGDKFNPFPHDLEVLPVNVHIDGEDLIWWDGKESKRIPADEWSPETEAFFRKTETTAELIKGAKLCNSVDELMGETPVYDDRLELWKLYGNTE